jgi:MFS family permease
MQNGGTSRGRRLDWIGSVLSIVGVTSLLLGLQGGGEHWAWTGWQSIALFATSAAAIGLFVRNELRAPDPILDLKLFANRTFMVAALLGFMLGAGMFGAIVFFPWFIQGVIGASATSAGTVLMPMTLMMVAASVVGGQIAQRLEYRWQAGGGLLLVGAGFLLATRFTPATTLWGARAAIMVLGFGVGLVQPILTIAVQQAFGREKRGTVTAAITFFRAVGSTVGVTLFGILFNWQMSRQFDLRLAPKLNGLPTALVDKPSNLVQILLQPQLRARFPEAVATVKTMMAGAIHPVFWISVGVMVCGILSAQLFGRESLTAQTQRQAAEASRAAR